MLKKTFVRTVEYASDAVKTFSQTVEYVSNMAIMYIMFFCKHVEYGNRDLWIK